jgi:hypothetical protein
MGMNAAGRAGQRLAEHQTPCSSEVPNLKTLNARIAAGENNDQIGF